jgi:hypothetical protein
MHMPKKIGVLTFHRCINYGSYWQARCIVESLCERGHDAVLLDHRSARINRAEWTCAFRPTLPLPTAATDYPLYAAKVRKFFAASSALPLSRPFPLENPSETDFYDRIIVGSDEVWNFGHPWYAGYPVFFGEGLKTGRLVSYAASFGSYDPAGPLDQPWMDRLKRFAAIAVRDENSRRVVQETLGQEAAIVLDPCLQFAGLCRRISRCEIAGHAVVYGHGFPQWFIHAARNWAADRGLRLRSVGYRNDWADEQWLTAGPEEFAQAIADAAAVITNFFHGCVFALVNAKPFVCTLSHYRSTKIKALVSVLGAEEHLIMEDTPRSRFDRVLDQPCKPSISRRIDMLRQRSSAYLDQALS